MILLYSLVLSSFATGIHSDQVSCPIGDDTAKIFFVLSSNEYGGYDSDGATYSVECNIENMNIHLLSKLIFSSRHGYE